MNILSQKPFIIAPLPMVDPGQVSYLWENLGMCWYCSDRKSLMALQAHWSSALQYTLKFHSLLCCLSLPNSFSAPHHKSVAHYRSWKRKMLWIKYVMVLPCRVTSVSDSLHSKLAKENSGILNLPNQGKCLENCFYQQISILLILNKNFRAIFVHWGRERPVDDSGDWNARSPLVLISKMKLISWLHILWTPQADTILLQWDEF